MTFSSSQGALIETTSSDGYRPSASAANLPGSPTSRDAHPHQNAEAITTYKPSNAAPSSHTDSASMMMNATASTDATRVVTSSGGKTKVNAVPPITNDSRTNTGASTSAICSGLLRMTDNA